MARMVPVGMDFWASRRSPERLEPAMMPGEREDSATVGRAAGQALREPRARQGTGSVVCPGRTWANSAAEQALPRSSSPACCPEMQPEAT